MDPSFLGWGPAFAAGFCQLEQPRWQPARVAFAARDRWRLMYPGGETAATLAGRLRHRPEADAVVPVVGDWVAIAPPRDGPAVIQAVLPRQSTLSRQEAGGRKDQVAFRPGQVLAANVDTAFVVCGLDRDFSLRRIERYVTLAYSCGIQPVVVLNKADLCAAAAQREAEVEAIAPGVVVRALSALGEDGPGWLSAHLTRGRTACFLGSSGAGKSTLINRLLGRQELRTGATSGVSGKGQHTTTHRELFLLEGGGIVIDTPGLREVGLAANREEAQATFGEIHELARGCRYRDCTHQGEPGCAVAAAVGRGELDASRLDSFQRLGRELAHRELTQDIGAAAVERRKWKAIKKTIRRL